MNSEAKFLMAMEVYRATDGWHFLNLTLQGTSSGDHLQTFGETEKTFVGTVNPIEVLDAYILPNGRFLILLSSSKGQLTQIVESKIFAEMKAGLFDWVLVESESQILKAIFSLSQVEIGDSILILESRSACRLLELCRAAIEMPEIKISDIRLGRGTGGTAIAYLTAKASALQECSKTLFSKFSEDNRPEWHHQVLTNIAKPLREFF